MKQEFAPGLVEEGPVNAERYQPGAAQRMLMKGRAGVLPRSSQKSEMRRLG